MKIKTSELTGAALDWAVAKCEGTLPASYDDWTQTWPHYSAKWAQGGPIIEREKMAIRFVPECYWHFTTPTDAWIANYDGAGEWYGPTPLVAAMRAFVASKLGDEVDVPEESV